MLVLRSITLLTRTPLGAKPFMNWFIPVWNKIDANRIEEVGPNRACAEWLLRCGATVRWRGSNTPMRDYNQLPVGQYRKHKIEEVDGTDSCITETGFGHFKDCEDIVKVKLQNCTHVTDFSLLQLTKQLGQKLEFLEITKNGNVTYKGLVNCAHMPALQELHLGELPAADQDHAKLLDRMAESVPKCKVVWPPHTEEAEKEE